MPTTTSLTGLPDHLLAEIAQGLTPAELAAACCSSHRWAEWSRAAGNVHWRNLYTAAWPAQRSWDWDGSMLWQTRYCGKMMEARSFSSFKGNKDGQYKVYNRAHSDRAHGVALLPAEGLLASGARDGELRLSDLSEGYALSKYTLPDSVTCVAMDGGGLFAGCGNHNIYWWEPYDANTYVPVGSVDEDAERGAPDAFSASCHRPPHFNLCDGHQLLAGHTAPVTCLSARECCLWSGSRDGTVRVWRREVAQPCEGVAMLTHEQAVLSVAARGQQLLVATQATVLVYDINTCQLVRELPGLQDEHHPRYVEMAESNDFAYTVGGDRALVQHDMRAPNDTRTLWTCTGSVGGIKLQHPWLACAAEEGVLLQHVEAPDSAKAFDPSVRLHLKVRHRAPLYCLDFANEWVAGAGTWIVRTWELSESSQDQGGRRSSKPRCKVNLPSQPRQREPQAQTYRASTSRHPKRSSRQLGCSSATAHVVDMEDVIEDSGRRVEKNPHRCWGTGADPGQRDHTPDAGTASQQASMPGCSASAAAAVVESMGSTSDTASSRCTRIDAQLSEATAAALAPYMPSYSRCVVM